MTNWLYALAICVGVLAYWILCRKTALKHQRRAVEMLEGFLNDDNISEKEKTKMFLNYRLFRNWFALPLFAVLTPFFVIFALASNKFQPEQLAKENSKEFDEFFGVLMQMYMARNPIISVFVLSGVGVSLAISLVIGTMLNKASKIPNHTLLVTGIAMKLLALKHKFRHAH